MQGLSSAALIHVLLHQLLLHVTTVSQQEWSLCQFSQHVNICSHASQTNRAVRDSYCTSFEQLQTEGGQNSSAMSLTHTNSMFCRCTFLSHYQTAPSNSWGSRCHNLNCAPTPSLYILIIPVCSCCGRSSTYSKSTLRCCLV